MTNIHPLQLGSYQQEPATGFILPGAPGAHATDAFWPADGQQGLPAQKPLHTILGNGRLYLLADGEPHSVDGSAASRCATDAISRAFYNQLLPYSASAADRVALLQQAVWAGHQSLLDLSRHKLICRYHTPVKVYSSTEAAGLPQNCPNCDRPLVGYLSKLAALLLHGSSAIVLGVGDAHLWRLPANYSQPVTERPFARSVALGLPRLTPQDLQAQHFILEAGDILLVCSRAVTRLLAAGHTHAQQQQRLRRQFNSPDLHQAAYTLLLALRREEQQSGRQQTPSDLSLLAVQYPITTTRQKARQTLKQARTHPDQYRALFEVLLHEADENLWQEFQTLLQPSSPSPKMPPARPAPLVAAEPSFPRTITEPVVNPAPPLPESRRQLPPPAVEPLRQAAEALRQIAIAAFAKQDLEGACRQLDGLRQQQSAWMLHAEQWTRLMQQPTAPPPLPRLATTLSEKERANYYDLSLLAQTLAAMQRLLATCQQAAQLSAEQLLPSDQPLWRAGVAAAAQLQARSRLIPPQWQLCSSNMERLAQTLADGEQGDWAGVFAHLAALQPDKITPVRTVRAAFLQMWISRWAQIDAAALADAPWLPRILSQPAAEWGADEAQWERLQRWQAVWSAASPLMALGQLLARFGDATDYQDPVWQQQAARLLPAAREELRQILLEPKQAPPAALLGLQLPEPEPAFSPELSEMAKLLVLFIPLWRYERQQAWIPALALSHQASQLPALAAAEQAQLQAQHEWQRDQAYQAALTLAAQPEQTPPEVVESWIAQLREQSLLPDLQKLLQAISLRQRQKNAQAAQLMAAAVAQMPARRRPAFAQMARQHYPHSIWQKFSRRFRSRLVTQ